MVHIDAHTHTYSHTHSHTYTCTQTRFVIEFNCGDFEKKIFKFAGSAADGNSRNGLHICLAFKTPSKSTEKTTHTHDKIEANQQTHNRREMLCWMLITYIIQHKNWLGISWKVPNWIFDWLLESLMNIMCFVTVFVWKPIINIIISYVAR